MQVLNLVVCRDCCDNSCVAVIDVVLVDADIRSFPTESSHLHRRLGEANLVEEYDLSLSPLC